MNNIFEKDQQTKLEKEKEEERKETLKVTGVVIATLLFLVLFIIVLFYSGSLKDYLTRYVSNTAIGQGKQSQYVNMFLSLIGIFLYIGIFKLLSALPDELKKFGMKQNSSFDLPFNFDLGNGYTLTEVSGMISEFTFYFFIMVIFIFFNFNTAEANNAIFMLANVMFVYFMFIMTIVINIAQPQPGSTISNVDMVITGFVAFSIMGMFALYTKVITDDKAMDLFKTFLPLPELNFIFRLIMFIPCIFIYTINFFRYQIDPGVTPPTILILLVINILVITGYILYKTIKPDVTKLILNEPIYLNRKEKLSEEDMLLYDRDIKKYKYSLSFWVNINRVKSRDKDIEILELSNKLKVLYNESSGELTVQYIKENGTTDDWEKYLGTNNFPLQKWNHIILNYNSGILDVFLNNKLLFSQSGVIIKNSRNKIHSGEDNGLTGGICHIKYFNRVLTLDEIDRFYHKYKNSNPPVV